MKQLYLLRHAKSDWGRLTRSDHDRPLNERGHLAAQKMADHLVRIWQKAGAITEAGPIYIYCSTATRAQETMAPVLRACDKAGIQYHVTSDEKLYLACAETLISRIQALPDTIQRCLFIGHNPGFEDLALCLTENRDYPAYIEIDYKYVTAGLCQFENHHGTWQATDEKSLKLTGYTKPKTL